MRYTIYKITNSINEKFYIGKHQTKNPQDKYFGSGKAIVAAIRLHGKEHFIKEILFDFDTEEEMNNKEKELISETLVADPMSYNLALGGEGGPHFKGKKHSDKTKAVIGAQRLGTKSSPETIAKLSAIRPSRETKQKISDAAKRRVLSEKSKQKISNSLKLYRETNPIPEDVRQKISKTMKIIQKNKKQKPPA